ncbi:MAG TPA: ABC transporter ATP-binding protein [Candidatus Paceibacterota bacterium]|nr:ABC transporter ATP-binding protein [Candidatus Paceibacterota bacterium]
MATLDGTAPAIEVKEVRKVYQKQGKQEATTALTGVSLSIAQGEFFALLGPNGAGKSSLIGILSGLVNKSGGSASICGIDIDAHPAAAKSFIGLVPQEMNFNIFEKVLDIVVDQAGYYGMTRAQALPRAEQVLKDLGLWEKRDAKAQALSGGMKRRLLIARALVHEPKVLLLDEPTAGVDVELRRGMWDFLRELNASGTTIVLTTHYLEEAELLCRRVAIINKGAIIEQGSVKELLTKLNFVTLTLDATEPVKDAALVLLREMKLTRIDENTLELTLSPGETVNDAMRKISSAGIQVANVRNAGSRLEEVFMNLIKN